MFNAIKRKLPLIGVLGIASTALLGTISCDNAEKREKASADSIVDVARALIEAQRYEEAFAAIDGLDTIYPKQLEARRQATAIRSAAMVDYSQQQYNVTDSLIIAIEAQLDELVPEFKHVSGGDISGYYMVEKAHNQNFLNATAVEARVDDDDYSFYIVAINNGKHIGINQIGIEGSNGNVKSAVIPAGNERSGDLSADGIDMASFVSSEVEPLATWAIDNAATAKKIVLYGKNGGTATISTTPQQVAAIAKAFKLSQLSRELQLARIRRDKFEKQLIIARDHTANLN